eukprot:Nk52_evm30s304 gene=Nk52_evmTU30s304
MRIRGVLCWRLITLMILGRTLRVDHVKDYRPPKELENSDVKPLMQRYREAALKRKRAERANGDSDEYSDCDSNKKAKKKKKKKEKKEKKKSKKHSKESKY